MTNQNAPVKVGIIGCGRVTETRHLPALRRLPQASVVALADVDRDRLRLVADRFRIERRHVDYTALLDDPAVQAVAVCVPAQHHVEVALAALEAGKHLLIEKPLALSLDESDRLISRAATFRSKIMVGFNLRWHRLVRHAREIIQRGVLGPPQLIHTAFTASTRLRGPVAPW